MTNNLCCILNGEKKGGDHMNVTCDCGRLLCEDCVAKIFGTAVRDRPERISKLWPKSTLNVLADQHYYYDKNCAAVQYYIKTFGQPILNETQTSDRESNAGQV